MFKIIRSKCCGLDVHKTWIYACIGIADSNSRVEYKQARFSSFSKGLKELSEWLSFDAHTYLLVATYYFQTFILPIKQAAGNFPA